MEYFRIIERYKGTKSPFRFIFAIHSSCDCTKKSEHHYDGDLWWTDLHYGDLCGILVKNKKTKDYFKSSDCGGDGCGTNPGHTWLQSHSLFPYSYVGKLSYKVPVDKTKNVRHKFT